MSGLGRLYPKKRERMRLMPMDDIGDWNDKEAMQKKIREMPREAREKFVAFLLGFKTYKDIQETLGICRKTIYVYSKKHPEIGESSRATRNFILGEVAERKSLELMESIKVENIEDKEKARSVKYLMEAADLAQNQVNQFSGQKEDEGDTMELIFKIKKKMGGGAEQRVIEAESQEV